MRGRLRGGRAAPCGVRGGGAELGVGEIANPQQQTAALVAFVAAVSQGRQGWARVLCGFCAPRNRVLKVGNAVER